MFHILIWAEFTNLHTFKFCNISLFSKDLISSQNSLFCHKWPIYVRKNIRLEIFCYKIPTLVTSDPFLSNRWIFEAKSENFVLKIDFVQKNLTPRLSACPSSPTKMSPTWNLGLYFQFSILSLIINYLHLWKWRDLKKVLENFQKFISQERHIRNLI